MERCAPEIFLDIFSLACNDGGLTGRSLSLVSRYIRQVGICQVPVYLSTQITTEKIPTGILPRTPICREFLKRMLFRVTDSYSDSVAEEIACRTRLQSLVHAAILRILTLISPTLRTLALQAGWYSLLPLPIPLHLPALVELAIGFSEINDLAGIIDNIRIFAPSITHLCIPAYVLPLHLLSLMLPILQKGTDRVIEPSGNATFPSTLRMLLMHDSDIAYSEPNLSARLSKLQEDCRVVFVDRK